MNERDAQEELAHKQSIAKLAESNLPLMIGAIVTIGLAGVLAIFACSYFVPTQTNSVTVSLVTIITLVSSHLFAALKGGEQVGMLKSEVIELKLQINHRMDALLAAKQEEGRQAGKLQEQTSQALQVAASMAADSPLAAALSPHDVDSGDTVSPPKSVRMDDIAPPPPSRSETAAAKKSGKPSKTGTKAKDKPKAKPRRTKK